MQADRARNTKRVGESIQTPSIVVRSPAEPRRQTRPRGDVVFMKTKQAGILHFWPTVCGLFAGLLKADRQKSE